MKKLIAFLALAAMPTLSVADAIRCGSRLLLVGDSSAELGALCGQPAQIDRSTGYPGGGNVRAGVRAPAGGSDDQISVETWTYNFGPNLLMQRVRIENGVIVQIESLGYGYNEPD